MSETIEVRFDPKEDVPSWAQNCPEAVKLAQRNLAFRCNLWDAQTKGYRRQLLAQARRFHATNAE